MTGPTYSHGATVVDKLYARGLYVAGGGVIQCYDPVTNKCECLVEEQCFANKRVRQMCGIEGVIYTVDGGFCDKTEN